MSLLLRLGLPATGRTSAPTPGLRIDGATVFEGTLAQVPCRMVGPSPEGSVTIKTEDGTATVSNGDYNANTQVLNFDPLTAGQSQTKYFPVQTNPDDIANEPDIYCLAKVDGATALPVVKDEGQVVIRDANGPPTISSNNPTAQEGSDLTYTLTLQSKTAKSVKVNYATRPGPGTPQSAFTPVSGSHTFPIDTTNDTQTHDVVVQTYTGFLSGDGTVYLDIEIASDSEGDGNVTTPTATGTIEHVYAPVIDGLPTISGEAVVGQTLTATYAPVSANPPATNSGQWYKDSLFPIPGATDLTYLIQPADEGSILDFQQTASNGINPDATAISDPVGPVTAPDTMVWSIANAAPVAEGASASMAISRTDATGAATIQFASSNGTPPTEARAGENYTDADQTVNFADGEASKPVLIPTLDDNFYNPANNWTGTGKISAPSVGEIGAGQDEGTFTITNASAQPNIDIQDTATAEWGSTGNSVPVTMTNNDTEEDVVFGVSSDNPSLTITNSGNQLTFAKGPLTNVPRSRVPRIENVTFDVAAGTGTDTATITITRFFGDATVTQSTCVVTIEEGVVLPPLDHRWPGDFV